MEHCLETGSSLGAGRSWRIERHVGSAAGTPEPTGLGTCCRSCGLELVAVGSVWLIDRDVREPSQNEVMIDEHIVFTSIDVRKEPTEMVPCFDISFESNRRAGRYECGDVGCCLCPETLHRTVGVNGLRSVDPQQAHNLFFSAWESNNDGVAIDDVRDGRRRLGSVLGSCGRREGAGTAHQNQRNALGNPHVSE